MTGLEFLAEAVVEGRLPCAIVLVTGQGNEAIAVEAMKRGAQDYLVKDQMNPSNLWRAITVAVTQTELRHRLANSMRDLTAANAALEQEITSRKAIEDDLRAAKDTAEQGSQAKTRFVAMVTHELRTPLNAILGYAQLLRVEGGLSDQQDARVGEMIRAGRHLLEMIERVLDFASIETGRMELRPVLVNIADLAEGCMTFIDPIANNRGLGLRMVRSRAAPRQVLCDAPRLRQVLLNLLGNAVKYTAAGSVELRILPGTAPGSLRIEVADTGTGIDTAGHDRLFVDFERLDAASSVEGAGLGLAISARIVTQMGGTIGHAENPGGGSVFWLELPPTEAPPPPPPEAVPTPEAPDPAGGRILLVDDIAVNRDLIGAFLRTGGHEVVQAESGREAVRLARDQTFDLILMDVRMPEMDGLEATRRIRGLPPPHGLVTVVALSAYALRDQMEQCRKSGMDGYIAKPVDYATLMRMVADTIAGTPPGWTTAPPDPPTPQSATMEPARDTAQPRLDHAALEQMLMFLPPDEATRHLRTLRTRTEEVLRLLDQPTAPELLAQTAHGLAAVTGMFGLAALSAMTRRLEQALLRNAPEEAEQLSHQVRTEARMAIVALDALIHDRRMQPA
jgi:signal transduction histidine kinase/HPt (histidine-containing phosphotransfer) domain-containing protein